MNDCPRCIWRDTLMYLEKTVGMIKRGALDRRMKLSEADAFAEGVCKTIKEELLPLEQQAFRSGGNLNEMCHHAEPDEVRPVLVRLLRTYADWLEEK